MTSTITVLSLVVALVGSLVVAELPPLEKSYKILMLSPFSTKSHRNFFRALATPLADRGHQVVLLTNFPPSSSHPGVTEVTHGLQDFDEEQMSLFHLKDDVSELFNMFEEIPIAMARRMYEVEAVMDLYRKRHEFDLMIVDDIINEIAYPFLAGRPFMSLAAPGLDVCNSAGMGNVINPAYGPGLLKVLDQPLTLLGRASNMFEYMFFCWHWKKWSSVPRIEKELTAHFPNLPPLLEIESNLSLTLLNQHFAINDPLPLLPSQVEVGGLHCRQARPLPAELESWISGAGEAGAIYFSLGTLTRGTSMPSRFRKMFLEVFGRLEQRVVWKFEGEMEEEVPANVMLRDWLPQQDILGHPQLRVFVSHGGLLSTQEAFHHGVPVLALPILFDQPKNAALLEARGLGLALDWEELTPGLLEATLKELMQNETYRQSAKEVSLLMQDRPVSPKDLAVYWVEYFIRHGGAPRLRTPARLLSWREYLMLDVLLLIQVLAYVAYRLTKCLLCCVYRKAVGAKQKPKLE